MDEPEDGGAGAGVFGDLGGRADTFSSGSAALDFDPGQLAPGRSYRWRAWAGIMRAVSDDRGWSPWCEFTVSPAAPDFRLLGDADLDVLRELGLRPDREYTITLSGPQRRLLREITGVGRGTTALTLSGPRWTKLLTQLADEAYVRTDGAIDIGEDADPHGAAYWALVDAISVKLGGPRHPRLQHR